MAVAELMKRQPPPRSLDSEGGGLDLPRNIALAATVLLSAWLLFQVQPMVAKRILPWFGGGSAVWTTVMLFFQTTLFAGYLYAHVVARQPPRRQLLVHLGLLAAAALSLAAVGVVPADRWKPQGSDQPTLHILAMLAACVGPPYLALAATAPLVQAWFSRANPGRSPYRLYALSNAGSLAALVSYPLIVEPSLGLSRQGLIWSLLFAGFTVLCVASGALSLRGREAAASAPADALDGEDGDATIERHFMWLALPACASVLLLGVTDHLCRDVSPIPLLWIVPMVVYLLSFILTFESDRWYRRAFWLPLAAAAAAAVVANWYAPAWRHIYWRVGAHLLLLMAACMICHGELARLRPPARRLTSFYLFIAAGGALGGLLAAVVAPLAFSDHYELPLAILATFVLAIAALVRDRQSPFYDGRNFAVLLGMSVALIALGVAMFTHAARRRAGAETLVRNFYGVLKVQVMDGKAEDYVELTNGAIAHGAQFRTDVHRRVPMWYYYPQSGVGQALLNIEAGARRIGVVGLGAGTLAAYGETGDRFTFFEINPQVITLADYHFTYLRDARDRGADVEFVEGDARLSLERMPPQQFDLLALDAFNSDAVPVHLLTREAFELYLRHLKSPDGVLAVHVTNEHLDLRTVIQSAAEALSLEAVHLDVSSDGTPGQYGTEWTLLYRPGSRFDQVKLGVPLETLTSDKPAVSWTDDFSNILEVVKD